ncbi:hypothetical protein JXM67_12020 [candidate division WOR-3 bacterium]|nr:hypothetical protein [candidate division WOR-3 bacterium]
MSNKINEECLAIFDDIRNTLKQVATKEAQDEVAQDVKNLQSDVKDIRNTVEALRGDVQLIAENYVAPGHQEKLKAAKPPRASYTPKKAHPSTGVASG